MNRLLEMFQQCDGYICEQVATAGLAIVTFTIMFLSISQIAG